MTKCRKHKKGFNDFKKDYNKNKKIWEDFIGDTGKEPGEFTRLIQRLVEKRGIKIVHTEYRVKKEEETCEKYDKKGEVNDICGIRLP